MISCYLQSVLAVVVGEIKIECIVLKLHEMDKSKKYRFTLICIKYMTLLSTSGSLKMVTELCLL
jgi:hypothetical protein